MAATAEYHREWRRKNPDKRKAYDDRGYEKRRKVLATLKDKCARCGFDNPDALDFHHLDPEDKSFQGAYWWTLAISRIKDEAKKCEVLCANCHRIEHAERRRA